MLSDSHGRANTTQSAVDVLVRHGAEVLIHLGDVGTVEVIDALLTAGADGQKPVQAHLVFGNTDWDEAALARYAQSLGVSVDHPAGRLSLSEADGGGELAFCHGHEPGPMDEALRDKVRYLCHGHTHRTLDSRRGGTRIINPGALFRATTYTVALLEPDTDALTFLEVPEAVN